MKQNIVYIRTSTEEQNPQNQLKDCYALAEKLNLQEFEVLEEKQSAFKDIKREVFNSIRKSIEQNKVENLIVWDLDRLFRNRKKLVEFFEFCKIYNCKIYSARQEWLQSINSIQEPFNEIMHNLMLQIMGWLAEEESSKKSMRIKSAVRKKKDITVSYKGNKWGRKTITTSRLKQQVQELRKQGLSIREIAKQVFVYDKSNNKKPISYSLVFKLLNDLKTKEFKNGCNKNKNKK